MSDATFLDRIVERNRAFVAGRAARPLPPLEQLHLAVVGCYDPRLDDLFQPALGYQPGKTFLFRTAGALVQPSGATLRSLSMAVYMFGVHEVLVVGHTSCRMAQFKSSEFVEMFRSRGVLRDAFGPTDLREWAGAIPSPRRGVAISVANIASAPFLPQDLVVAGVVLNDETGAIEVVVRPGEVKTRAEMTIEPQARAQEQEEETEPEHDESGTTETAEPQVAASAGGEGDSALGELAKDVSDFTTLLRGKQRWRNDLELLEGELARSHSPLVKFRMLETLAKRAGAESREVMDAFERLKRSAIAARQGFDKEGLYRLFQRFARRSK